MARIDAASSTARRDELVPWDWQAPEEVGRLAA
jgi:hypothetical protein